MAASTPTLDGHPLSQLEERIERAVALVARLRQEKETALADAAAVQASLEAAETRNLALTQESESLRAELELLRAERSQVRTRLEKLIGHIDQLGAA
jgi:chromosome segregation ATPase